MAGRKMAGVTCAHCGRPRQPHRGGHGYCNACYVRWVRAGRPVTGPSPVRSKVARLEDLRWVLDTSRVPRGAQGIEQLARRTGLHPHTVYKYLAELGRAADSS